jgi:hypothetical protein
MFDLLEHLLVEVGDVDVLAILLCSFKGVCISLRIQIEVSWLGYRVSELLRAYIGEWTGISSVS